MKPTKQFTLTALFAACLALALTTAGRGKDVKKL